MGQQIILIDELQSNESQEDSDKIIEKLLKEEDPLEEPMNKKRNGNFPQSAIYDSRKTNPNLKNYNPSRTFQKVNTQN